jgi:hypothetical protein
MQVTIMCKLFFVSAAHPIQRSTLLQRCGQLSVRAARLLLCQHMRAVAQWTQLQKAPALTLTALLISTLLLPAHSPRLV